MKSGFKKIIILVFAIVFGFCSFQGECFAKKKNTANNAAEEALEESLPSIEDYFEIKRVPLVYDGEVLNLHEVHKFSDEEIYVDAYKRGLRGWQAFLYNIKTDELKPIKLKYGYFTFTGNGSYFTTNGQCDDERDENGKSAHGFALYDTKTDTLKNFKGEARMKGHSKDLKKLNNHLFIRDDDGKVFTDKNGNTHSIQLYDTKKMECFFPKAVSKEYIEGQKEDATNEGLVKDTWQGHIEILYSLNENEHLIERSTYEEGPLFRGVMRLNQNISRFEIYNSKTNEFKPIERDIYIPKRESSLRGYTINSKNGTFYLEHSTPEGYTELLPYEYKDGKLKFLGAKRIEGVSWTSAYFFPLGEDEVIICNDYSPAFSYVKNCRPYIINLRTGESKMCKKFKTKIELYRITKLKEGVWFSYSEYTGVEAALEIFIRKERKEEIKKNKG